MFRLLTVALLLSRDVFAAELSPANELSGILDDKNDHKTLVWKNLSVQEIRKNFFRNLKLDPSLLVISYSNISRIDEEAFDGLDHLNKLELSNDMITKIEPKTFARLKGLEFLSLKSNKLRDVTLVLNNVQEIVLARNEIEELREDFITGGSVTYMDFKWNRLKSLDNSMRNFSKLSKICISNNEIEYIKPEVFADNENLCDLYASGNRLNSTEGVRLKQLHILDISFNRFKRLANDSFDGMTFLDTLLLNNNEISDINDAFAGVTNLRTLDLSFNHIEGLERDVFYNNPYLSKLTVSNNRIRSLEPFVKKLRYLARLDLSHNDLEAIRPGFFETVDKLEILNLSFNKLTRIGDAFRPLTCLTSLDLSSNALAFDRNTFHFNVKLKQLNLSSNGLDLTLSCFAENKQLTMLDLSRNNISEFCDVDMTMNSLTSLDLSHNKIYDLGCFKSNSFLPFFVIDIRNNPLKCDSNFDDVITHFVLMQSSPYKTQMFSMEDVHSPRRKQQTILDTWNAVKREICPNGHDIFITPVDRTLTNPEDFEEQSGASYEHQGWLADYEDEIREGMEYDDENETVQIDVKIDELPEKMYQSISERKSWNEINRVKNLAVEREDGAKEFEDINENEYSLFTITLIFIGVSLILIINVLIFMYIRMKWWMKNFRGIQKYTHLENKVYKDTTVPNDYAVLGGNKPNDNYRINCVRMFTNLGFRTSDGDTESVKKMMVDNGNKTEV